MDEELSLGAHLVILGLFLLSLAFFLSWAIPRSEADDLRVSVIVQECQHLYSKDPLQQKACIDLALTYKGDNK